MRRSFSDWGGNLAAFVLVLAMNTLSNVLPLNSQTMPEISAKYPSLFTPAGFTFSIWGVIYLGLMIFVIYQALPSQRDNDAISRISRLFQLSCLANAAWIVVWHYDLLWLSLLIMLLLLASLIGIYRQLLDEVEHAPVSQHLALHLPFSLYTGWITVATIANVSVLQTANGWDSAGLTAISWTLMKLAVAGAIGATVISRVGDAVFILVIAWASYGISVMQSATPAVSGAATVLSLLALMLAASEGVSRLRRRA